MKRVLLSLLAISAICSLSAQESNNGKQLWAKSYLNEKAPELVVEKWLSDKPELEGKFILVDFWATWCGPCRRGIPEMNEFSKQFSQDLVIIALSDETEDKIKAMKEPVIEYYSATDTKRTLLNQFEVKGIPHAVLIDPHGIVRWEGLPGLTDHKLTSEVMENLINKYK